MHPSTRLLCAIALCATVPAHAAEAPHAKAAAKTPAERHLYYTGGVHNDLGCVPQSRCIYPRKPGEPTDPQFPKWWTSEWTMYRVFDNYEQYPPPYASPPAGLAPADYQVSKGATWYDATYVPKDKDGTGAMMEHYEKFCLPIFPMANNYSCSFVSLGNKAYFLRYEDRPPNTPKCCQFSLMNHPPRTDFIKHLPYNAKESGHLDGSVQAYSRLVPPGILFGYAFEKEARPDSHDKDAPPYRHPQSFYFSGQPTTPPDAPIVSQNYENFRMQKPDPATTWDQVAAMCPAKPEWCCLFDSDCPDNSPNAAVQKPAADWTDLRQ